MVDIVHLDGALVYSLLLVDMSAKMPMLAPDFKMVEYSLSGPREIEGVLQYFHGYVLNTELSSHVHGSFYHDQAFEGIVRLANRSIYFEAIDRYQSWNQSESVMYEREDFSRVEGPTPLYLDRVDDYSTPYETDIGDALETAYRPLLSAAMRHTTRSR